MIYIIAGIKNLKKGMGIYEKDSFCYAFNNHDIYNKFL